CRRHCTPPTDPASAGPMTGSDLRRRHPTASPGYNSARLCAVSRRLLLILLGFFPRGLGITFRAPFHPCGVAYVRWMNRLVSHARATRGFDSWCWKFRAEDWKGLGPRFPRGRAELAPVRTGPALRDDQTSFGLGT